MVPQPLTVARAENEICGLAFIVTLQNGDRYVTVLLAIERLADLFSARIYVGLERKKPNGASKCWHLHQDISTYLKIRDRNPLQRII